MEESKRVIVNVEKLLVEIKKRPVIFDTKCYAYTNKAAKANAWEEICAEVVAEWNHLNYWEKTEKMKQVQKRWKNLRDHFVKELKHLKRDPERKTKYIYFDLLRFLTPYIKNRNGQIMFNECNSTPATPEVSDCEENDNTNNETQMRTDYSLDWKFFPDVTTHSNEYKSNNAEQTSNLILLGPEYNYVPPEVSLAEPKDEDTDVIRPPKSRKRVNKSKFEAEVLKILRENDIKEQQEKDEDRMFLLSLLCDFKNIPEHKKLLVKGEIINTILRAQESEQQNYNMIPVNSSNSSGWV